MDRWAKSRDSQRVADKWKSKLRSTEEKIMADLRRRDMTLDPAECRSASELGEKERKLVRKYTYNSSNNNE